MSTIIKGSDVAASFGAGASFLSTPEYRVSTARRESAGVVEVHTVDTDIFYVIEGSATLVTGGEMQEPQTVAPNEIRGSSIVGGVTDVVGPGDIIVIPNKEPHWFKEVPAPFVYLVIKSTTR
jgi:quercetin dioxygenase-like cupin family protein